MMSDMQITVFMPVYNAEKTLKAAMDSILGQTYTHFEFLIIDDGSTDKSVEIVQSYTDPRIRLLKNEQNLGVVETANRGIDMASFELIARMDADDIAFAERLEKQVSYFLQNPDCAMLATWAQDTDFNNEVIRIERIDPDLYYYNLNFECWIYQPTVMFKRNAVIDVGKYEVKYSEDFDLWWRFSRKYKIYVLPEILLNYRSSDNSLSRVTRKKEYEDAHFNQLLRNVHYYTGHDFKLETYEAEFLRSHLDPACERGIETIMSSFKKLDYITACILKKEPQHEAIIKKGASFKKKRLLLYLNDYLDQKTIAKLLFRLSYWSMLKSHINKMFYRKLKRIKKEKTF